MIFKFANFSSLIYSLGFALILVWFIYFFSKNDFI